MIIIKSPQEIELMRRAGHITATALAKVGAAVRPGVTTKELDTIAYDVITGAGAKPSFLGYNKFPASICVSINEQLIHGIPGKRRIAEGDIVSVDVGACFNGFNGDAAATFAVGRISDEAQKLIDVTRQSFFDAARAVKPNVRISEVSRAIQTRAESAGYGVVRKFTGHGVGKALHEDPEVPCFVGRARGARLMPGMTIAIEPMVCLGNGDVEYLDDNTTVVTCDRRLCAHYEHTVLVTDEGFELLTYIEGLSV